MHARPHCWHHNVLLNIAVNAGTFSYASPELLLGVRGVTFSTDVFSFGVLLWCASLRRTQKSTLHPGTKLNLMARLSETHVSPTLTAMLTAVLHPALREICTQETPIRGQLRCDCPLNREPPQQRLMCILSCGRVHSKAHKTPQERQILIPFAVLRGHPSAPGSANVHRLIV